MMLLLLEDMNHKITYDYHINNHQETQGDTTLHHDKIRMRDLRGEQRDVDTCYGSQNIIIYFEVL